MRMYEKSLMSVVLSCSLSAFCEQENDDDDDEDDVYILSFRL